MEEKIELLLKDVIENLGYELYDVIYEKEAQDYYLRIFIDMPNGISLNDCEKVNDVVNPILDEANYIKEQYFLEVSSPGIERRIRKNKHLQKNIGQKVEIKLYSPIQIQQENIQNTKNKKQNSKSATKNICGILKKFTEETITIEPENNPKNSELQIERKNISNIKIKFNW